MSDRSTEHVNCIGSGCRAPALVAENEQLRAQLERALGCLRNCSGKIYHPRMPNLVAALEKEIRDITGLL